MITARATTARGAVAAAIAPHFPPRAGWQLVEHEGKVDDSAKVRVRVTVREIGPSDTGSSRMHLVTTHVTFTIPTDALDDAEEQLDGDMDDFLHALDQADVPWSKATKGQFADEGGRLGFQLDIETRTTPTEETTNG